MNLKIIHLKTAAQQKMGADCTFLQFGIIIIYCVLNLGFKKDAAECDITSQPLQCPNKFCMFKV